MILRPNSSNFCKNSTNLSIIIKCTEAQLYLLFSFLPAAGQTESCRIGLAGAATDFTDGGGIQALDLDAAVDTDVRGASVMPLP